MPHWGYVALLVVNYYILFLFACELFIALVAEGPRKFFRGRFNRLDVVILAAAVIEAAFYGIFYHELVICVSRAFLIFRAFRFSKALVTLHALLEAVWKTLRCGCVCVHLHAGCWVHKYLSCAACL